jgi:hypothetical protein
VQRLRVELHHKRALVDKLTHENATLKRLKFAAKSEAYSAEQKSLIPCVACHKPVASEHRLVVIKALREHALRQPAR